MILQESFMFDAVTLCVSSKNQLAQVPTKRVWLFISDEQE
jgi:hypothetical protein